MSTGTAPVGALLSLEQCLANSGDLENHWKRIIRFNQASIASYGVKTWVSWLIVVLVMVYFVVSLSYLFYVVMKKTLIFFCCCRGARRKFRGQKHNKRNKLNGCNFICAVCLDATKSAAHSINFYTQQRQHQQPMLFMATTPSQTTTISPP